MRELGKYALNAAFALALMATVFATALFLSDVFRGEANALELIAVVVGAGAVWIITRWADRTGAF